MSEARFGSGLSNADDPRRAVAEACEAALAGWTGAPPDVAVFFTTPHHPEGEQALGRAVRERTDARVLLGSTAQAVIGGGRESEEGPGLAVWVARLPGAEARPFILAPQEAPEPPLEDWKASIPLRAPPPGARGKEAESALVLLVADPFSLQIVSALDLVNDEWPGTPVVGGIASAGVRPGTNRLYAQDVVVNAGAVGLVIAGPLAVRTIVSQGCRPIGKHLVITKARGNIIQAIGGKPALAALRDVIGGLDERDQMLAARALHVGRAIDERREKFGRGDFLIRNPIGVDPASGALAVADTFRAGQTIQLHVRDARSADEDLRYLLEGAGAARGALLFSCNGRGRRFFGAENHDTNVLKEILGRDLAVGGFFCGGEFGPIAGRNFVHGYTSSVAVFG